MTTNSRNNPGIDVLFIFTIIRKYRIHLILVAVASIILSAIFSSETFIHPKFKSTAVVYPSNLVPYSTESPTEQMLQLFESEDIRDGLISDFNLFEHYEIDTTQKYPLTALYGQMRENIKIDKTKYESVEIEVLDTDPFIAKRMVDSLLANMNKKAQALQRQKSHEVVVILKHQLDLKKQEMDSMEIELKNIRENYGILDFEEQVRSFSRVYYTELAGGRVGQNSNRPMDKAMENMMAKGGDYLSLKEHLWRIRGTYNDLKVQYENSLKDLTKELTYSNLITRPVPAEKKSTPIRSLIVLLFTASMLILALIVIFLVEKPVAQKAG